MMKTMRVKTVNQLICVALAALPLSACGSGAVDAVKKTQFGDDATLTVGQALDHRKECESTNWSSEKDDRGRIVVTYACELKDVDAYVANKLSTANDDLKKKMAPPDNSMRASRLAREEGDLATAQASGNPQNIQFAQSELDGTKRENADLDKQEVEREAGYQKMIDENTQAVANNPLTKVNEQFQWVVADDGGVVLTGYSLTASYKSGIEKQLNVETGQVFRAIANDQQTDVAGYINAIRIRLPVGM